MPIYTYECDNCGVRFDRQQSFAERNLTRCPECNKKTLHRVYQPVGVVFKGSGFYVTDNRSSKKASINKPSSSDTKEKKETKPKKETSQAQDTKAKAKSNSKD